MIEVALLCIAAWLAHEAGHVVIAYAAGWRMRRLHGTKLGGVGLGFETRGRGEQLWAVALGGPFVSQLLMLAGACLPPSPAVYTFVMANALMVYLNLLPLPGSDGRAIWTTFPRGAERTHP